MTAEMVDQMMFDDAKYPESVVVRHFVRLTASNCSESMGKFTAGGFVLYHGESGRSYSLPMPAIPM